MADPIEFYFDFSSPYGYIASERIEALAAAYGRSVAWRPVLLGAVFKTTGAAPLISIPLKGEYSRRDFARTARFYGIEFRLPDPFPVSTVAPARAFYWLEGRQPLQAVELAKRLYRAYFAKGIDISSAEAVAEVCAEIGLAPADARAALADPAVKQTLKTRGDEALARGVFGSPFVFVDGEPFWGADRFDQIEKWLATGGF